MKKSEQAFTTKFLKWVRENPRTAAYELKSTRGKPSFPFREVQEHQLRALNIVNRGVLAYKIPDDSQGYKPFDAISLKGEPAYIVIKYPEFFCLISVETFVLESERSKRRSLTASRAKDIAVLVVPM